MKDGVTIFGHGAVGSATARMLASRGQRVRIAQRHRPVDLDASVEYCQADVLDPQSTRTAVSGSSQIVLAVGFAYSAKAWRRCWPLAMANVLQAAQAEGARVVFVDNLYMYGPQDAPLTETMPLCDFGAKPALRAAITRQWQASAAAGRVRFAALRAPDFYGPGVGNSHLGTYAFGALAAGKKAIVFVNPDVPHDFAYVPDFARGVVALLDAPDEDFGRAWHLPCAPTRSIRQILRAACEDECLALALRTIPRPMQGILGLCVPFVRELREMQFQWDRPYRVDATEFARRFRFVPTGFESGTAQTMRSFCGADSASNTQAAIGPPLKRNRT